MNATCVLHLLETLLVKHHFNKCKSQPSRRSISRAVSIIASIIFSTNDPIDLLKFLCSNVFPFCHDRAKWPSRWIEIGKATIRRKFAQREEPSDESLMNKLTRFLPDAPTVHCVAASRKASRTRRSWTTCCCRRVTTSGFCPRSKVHCGPPVPYRSKRYYDTPDPAPDHSWWSARLSSKHLEHHRHRYHYTAPHNHSSLLTPHRNGTLCRSTCARRYDSKKAWKRTGTRRDWGVKERGVMWEEVRLSEQFSALMSGFEFTWKAGKARNASNFAGYAGYPARESTPFVLLHSFFSVSTFGFQLEPILKTASCSLSISLEICIRFIRNHSCRCFPLAWLVKSVEKA
jgi:hypothetical protein